MKPASPDIAARLGQIPLFGCVPAQSLGRLAARTRELHPARGEMVFRKGDLPQGLYAVVAGKLKEAGQGRGSEEKILEILGAGDICGETALLMDCPHPFSVSALSNSAVLLVEKPAIDALIEATPGFVFGLLQRLATRQHGAMHDIEAYARASPLQRVVGYLIEQSCAGGEDRPSLSLAATKQVIASRLGMTPAAFSRTLRDLSEAGLISMRGRRVELCDQERLKGFAR